MTTPVDPFRPGVRVVDGPVDEPAYDRRLRTAQAAVVHTEAQLAKARAATVAAEVNVEVQLAMARSKVAENQREVDKLEAELAQFTAELAAVEAERA